MFATIHIAGPTATGKSEIAIELAERIGGEIVSVDSMQVYRGMDIGSAKVSKDERARVAHHLIDIVDVTEPYDAAAFVRDATMAERAIRSRGRIPVFCGGTGLYFKALFEGLGTAPPSDPAVRSEVELLTDEELQMELQTSDPVAFEAIDPGNRRRLVRAVESIRLTGRPFSELRTGWSRKGGVAIPNLFIVDRDRDELIMRIDHRVDQMFADGLVAETSSLLERGLESNRTALQAIGYRQVVGHLCGRRSLEETVGLIKARTRQFAKRQRTWFRHQFQGDHLSITGREPVVVAEELARRVA